MNNDDTEENNDITDDDEDDCGDKEGLDKLREKGSKPFQLSKECNLGAWTNRYIEDDEIKFMSGHKFRYSY